MRRLLLVLSAALLAVAVLLPYFIHSTDLYTLMPTWLVAATRIVSLSPKASSLPASLLRPHIAAYNMSASSASLTSSIHNVVLAAFAADSLALGGPYSNSHTRTANERPLAHFSQLLLY